MNLSIRNLTKTFFPPGGAEVPILADINLEVREGDFVVLLGESGSGKSTFLHMLAGLEAPTAGEIWQDGLNRPTEKVTGPHPSRLLLFQQPTLLPWLTIADNISFGCRLRSERCDLGYRVDQFIEMMGLYGQGKLYPHELSVGQAQRVCLARALIGHPDVLLLDEPFAALDTITRSHLQEELINIWQGERLTAVFVTHDIEEAILLGSKVVLLGDRPATVKEVIPIPLPYPRSITDEDFFHTKTRVVNRFKEIVTGFQQPELPELTDAVMHGEREVCR